MSNPQLYFNKPILVLLFFIIVTFPTYRELLKSGVMTGHDTGGHIIRTIELDKALGDGQFPVRWSKRLNWGLGYPFYNYNYPMNYYLGSLLSRMGFGYEMGFKLLLLLSFPLSGFFTYLWLKQQFDHLSSLIGGLLYTLVPYHFVNVYVRGNIGETLGLTIVPLVLYLGERVLQRHRLLDVCSLSVSGAFLITVHNLTSAIFLPIIAFYILLRIIAVRKFEKVKYFLLTFVFSLGLSAFFWVPALGEKSFVVLDQGFGKYYSKNFADIGRLIYSPWGYGFSNVGKEAGEMSFQIGLVHILVFLASSGLIFYDLFSRRKIYSAIVYFFLLAVFGMYLMVRESKVVWDNLTFLQYVQFPWRFLSVVILGISFMGAWGISRVRGMSNLGKMLTLVTVLSGMLFFNRNHWHANQFYNMPLEWLEDRPIASTTTLEDEHIPVWQSARLINEDINSRFQVLEGDANVIMGEWRSNYHRFEVNSKSDEVVMVDRTVYFPGWKVYIDKKEVKLLDPYETGGVIGFRIGRGSHIVESLFRETNIRFISDLVSLGTGVMLLMLIVCKRIYFSFKEK